MMPSCSRAFSAERAVWRLTPYFEDTTAEPEPKTGIACVRDAEVYHLACVARDAAFEAERLCTAIQRAASDTYLRDNGEAADSWLQANERDRQAEEALRCLETAQHYLRSLTSEPPF